MERITINANSPEEDIRKALFYGCFYYVYDMSKFEEYPEYDYEAFVSLCRDYGIEKYLKELYIYCVNLQPISEIEDLVSNNKSHKITLKNLAENYLLLSKFDPKSSKYVLKDDSREVGDLTIPDINVILEEYLQSIFKNGKYLLMSVNMFELAKIDEEWIKYHCQKRKIDEAQYIEFYELAKEDFLEEIAHGKEYELFCQERGLNEDFSSFVLGYLDSIHHKRRKPRTTLDTESWAELANKLHYILLFDTFRGQTEETSITDYTKSISNKHALIIHDILVYFGFIEDKSDSDNYLRNDHTNFVSTNLRRYRERKKKRLWGQNEVVTDEVLSALMQIKLHPKSTLIFNTPKKQEESIVSTAMRGYAGDVISRSFSDKSIITILTPED